MQLKVKLIFLILVINYLTSVGFSLYCENIQNITSDRNYIQCSSLNSFYYSDPETENRLLTKDITFELHAENDIAQVDIMGGLTYVDGYYTVTNLESILEEGEDTIKINTHKGIAGFRFQLPNVSVWGNIYDRMPGGGIEITSPDFYGFSIQSRAERMRRGGFIDLLKNFSLDYSLILDAANGSLHWNRNNIEVWAGVGIISPKIFTFRDLIETDLIIDIDCSSDFDIFTGFNIPFSTEWGIQTNYRFSYFNMQMAGAVDNMRFMEIFNSADAGKNITFCIQQFELMFNKNNSFTAGITYDNARLPYAEENSSYLEATPLSPVGTLYRLRYILTGFSGRTDIFGLSAGQTLLPGEIEINWQLDLKLLLWKASGSYYNIEGTATLPFMIWDMKQSPVENLNETGLLFIGLPQLSISLPLNPFIITAEASQLFPLAFSSDTFFQGDEAPTLSGIWGGTTAGIYLTIGL